jgi:hypothetical protein
VGQVAACGGFGDTSFVRWTITSGPPADAQALRTCVDRWNQGNMVGWGPTLASVDVAVRRVRDPVGQQSRCVVALAAHYKRHVYRDKTYVCVLSPGGAYGCPTNAEGSPPLRMPNATTDEHGALRLDRPLKGNASDTVARVAAVPARRRLRQAMDVHGNAARGPPLHGRRTRPLLRRRRDGHLRDQLPHPQR